MAFAEYLHLVKTYKLANGESATATLEAGTPYRHLTAWAHVAGAGAINVSAQPRFANEDDGAAVAFAAAGTKKVFQVTPEEVRPATRGLPKLDPPPHPIKSEMVITNSGDPVVVTLYMMAAAAPGGA